MTNQVNETTPKRTPPSSEELDDEIDLLALFATLWRGKWVIALMTVLAVAVALYYAVFVAVPKYQATASVILDVDGANIVDLQQVVTGISGDRVAINTELEVMRSSRLITELVERLELENDPEFNAELGPEAGFSLRKMLSEALSAIRPDAPGSEADGVPRDAALDTADAVREAISVSNQRDTYIFTIRATTTRPGKSIRIANSLAEIYIENQISAKFEATDEAVDWLSERVRDLEMDLRAQEDAVKELRSSSDLISPEGLDLLNQQLRAQRDRLERAQTTQADADARLKRLLAAREGAAWKDFLEIANDALLTRLAENSGTASTSFKERADLVVQRARQELERSNSQEASLRDALERLERQIEAQSADLIQLQQMERELAATRVLYETFLARLKETTVSRGLQQSDSRILSEAQTAIMVAPRTSLILALAGILGLMGSSGIVLAREAMRNHFRSSEELERRTGRTVIGQVPIMPIRKRAKLIDYLKEKPTSAAVEAIRNLRTSVLMSNVDDPPQVIMLTSSVPGEGKTSVAISLAHNLAGLGKRVLLIEGDIRRRTFSEYFKFSGQAGLVSLLATDGSLAETVQRDPRINVDIIMGEESRVNAADLFSSERFRKMLADARAQYDYVIIDTPPVLVVPDARVIGRSADAIVYMVRWDSTPQSQVAEGLRQLETVNLDVSGLVLTQVDPAGMKRYGYGERYGAYASYGHKYYG